MMDPRRHLIVTIHGIRTFASWQRRIEKLVKQSEPDVTVHHYRYGYLSIAVLLIPLLRMLAVRRFRTWLLHDVQSQSWARIDIVAHSFGTYLLARAMLSLSPEQRPRLDTVIFASSVLKSNFPWHKLIPSSISRLVNDCGVRDRVLILSQWFVPFSGMAGRIGFIGIESETLINRYFPYGHSDYFVDEHIICYWLPVLTSANSVEAKDCCPKPGFISGVRWWFIQNADPLKLSVVALVVGGPLLALIGFINTARARAEFQRQRAETLAREANHQRRLAEQRSNEADSQRRTAERRAMNSSIEAIAARALADNWWDRDDQRSALLAQAGLCTEQANGF